jgi:hypothetical protein
VLIVLDATPNLKLLQLEEAFVSNGGEVYKGAEAWQHLDSAAGPTMALFIEKYVRVPMQAILSQSSEQLPDFLAQMDSHGITLNVGGEAFRIGRGTFAAPEPPPDHPDDISDEIIGP